MNRLVLSLRDVRRSAFRGWAVAVCAAVVASLGLGTLLITNGARQSLDLAAGRLGADVLVLPKGTAAKVEGAILMGDPAQVWMPEGIVGRVRAVSGVQAASPQLYLASLSNASCCSVSNMFMVAFDPATDFTVQPWIEEQTSGRGLVIGGAIGGSLVTVPEDDTAIRLYGYPLALEAQLAPTGTNLDRSLFLTFETARDMARTSVTGAIKPLVIPSDSVSAVLVKVAPGSDAAAVALLINATVPEVTAVPSLQMFGAFRDHMTLVLSGVAAVLVLALVLAFIFVALVSSMATHERRREIGVLRALGATRSAVVLSMSAQTAVVTFAGGVVGAAGATLAIYLFRDLLVKALGFPIVLPGPVDLTLLLIVGVTALVAGATVAAALPAAVASLQEPATGMRE